MTLGGLPAAPPAGTDLVVTSPGMRPTTPLLVAAAAAGIAVWGEVELAWRLRPEGQDWLAITGTNGKTTTTQMLGAILAAAGLSSATAGNIGAPLVEVALGTGGPAPEVLAVELSSFQLHYTQTFAPRAGAILNLAADHLDWHGSMQAYVAAKARVWGPTGSPTNSPTVAVVNADDPQVVALRADAPSVTFGLSGAGVTVQDGYLVDHAYGGGQLARVDALAVPGAHNVAKALAAAALARAYGIAPGVIGAALTSFRLGSHRNELIATVAGVAYVNDSKATNPHAAAASLGAYPSVVWIGGGLNKGLDFDELVAGAASRLRAVVLIGRCADEIADALARHAAKIPVSRASSMDDAVVAAARLARPGDTVLLAPAAASMDMFRDYAARGDEFAAAARRLSEDA
ncbi:MAG: UDP-N-acetylmuramoylalanine/D-glutamate ligase [Mycobacterium sp.]|nr:UDP-N-acetylmuramoylalanine/D-glutamate ligase [Mycobacterium sp.]